MYSAGGSGQTGPLDNVPKALEGIFNTLKLLEPASTDFIEESVPSNKISVPPGDLAFDSASVSAKPHESQNSFAETPTLKIAAVLSDRYKITAVQDKENRYPTTGMRSSSKPATEQRKTASSDLKQSSAGRSSLEYVAPSNSLLPDSCGIRHFSVSSKADDSNEKPKVEVVGEEPPKPASTNIPAPCSNSETTKQPVFVAKVAELNGAAELKPVNKQRNFQPRRFGIMGPPIRSSAMTSLRGPLPDIPQSTESSKEEVEPNAFERRGHDSANNSPIVSAVDTCQSTTSSACSSNNSLKLHQSSAPRSSAPSLSPNTENTHSTIFSQLNSTNDHSHLQSLASATSSNQPLAYQQHSIKLPSPTLTQSRPPLPLTKPKSPQVNLPATQSVSVLPNTPAPLVSQTTQPAVQPLNQNHTRQNPSAPPPITATPVSVNTVRQDQQHPASSSSKKSTLFINGKAYTKLELVGRGGSSKVFRVLSPDSKLFALKRVPLKGLDQSTLQGYLNEIDLLRRLQGNERIIQLYDAEVNQFEGYLHMLMEFGEIDLAGLLQRQKDRRLNLNFIRVYWEQMLQAVHTIHEARVVHSDLKPANFLFVRGQLKLIDFGIAKAIQSDTTNIHRDHQVGTVNYMSPEAIIDTNVTISSSQNGEQLMKLGRPSDVWSLGCILYQMIYGKTPFAHLAMIPKIQKIIDPSYAIEFPQTIDGSPLLIDIMRSCLNRDPKRRPTIPQLIDHPFLHPDRLLNQVMNTVPQPLIEKVVHEVLRLQSQQNGPVSEESLARTIGELLNIGK